MYKKIVKMTLSLGVGGLLLGTAPPTVQKDERYVLPEKDFPAACEAMPLDQEECGRWYAASSAKKIIVLRDAHFEFGKSTLRNSAKPVLRRYVEVMKKNPKSHVQIVGYTDSIGSEKFNQGLSEKRAVAAKDFLIEQGIQADRIQLEGRGESAPLASNKTMEGRSKNRRVEMKLEGARRYSQNTRILYRR